ncbi:MAG: hypothetical protein JW739_07120 [Opitutales bacterium]|nr:hypothetical protein [Opitutales bacterium]
MKSKGYRKASFMPKEETGAKTDKNTQGHMDQRAPWQAGVDYGVFLIFLATQKCRTNTP